MKKIIFLSLLTVIVRAQCDPVEQCLYTFDLTDSQGNGWGANEFEIWQENNLVVTLGPQMADGLLELSMTVALCMNQPYFVVRSGQDDSQDEISLTLKNPFGVSIYSYPLMQVAHQPQYFGTAVCTADDCQPPIDLQVFQYDGSPKLHWTVGGDSPWEVIVLPHPSTAPGSDAAGTVSNCPFDLGNFTDQTYDIYVRTLCFWGGTSPWESLLAYNSILGTDAIKAPAFAMAPVPADEWLSITSAKPITGGVVTDAAGRSIMELPPTHKLEKIDISLLGPGLYFLTLEFESGDVATQSFLVR